MIYDVINTLSSVLQKSRTLEEWPTAIKTIIASKTFEVYPNPFNDTFYFESKTQGQLDIYNVALQHLKQVDVTLNKNTIDMANYDDGLYCISFLDENGTLSWDIVVKF